MNTYKITFSYNGSGFFGWQKQIDQKSIQGEIEKVVQKISKSQDIQVVGCGRTDAGVHAVKQVTRVKMPLKIEEDSLKNALNSLLPESIRASHVEMAHDDFQPVYDAKSKTYRYVFSLKKIANPFLKDTVSFIGKDINLTKMNEACKIFIGRHDFEGFSTKGTPVKTTIREITRCHIFKENINYGPGLSEDVYIFEVSGSGFLKQMVRLVVSAVWSYAEGKIEERDILNQFNNPSENKIAPTAPPQGLYLFDVQY